MEDVIEEDDGQGGADVERAQSRVSQDPCEGSRQQKEGRPLAAEVHIV